MRAQKTAYRRKAVKAESEKLPRRYVVTLFVSDTPLGLEDYFTPEEIVDAVQSENIGAGVVIEHYSIAEWKKNV